MLPYLTGHGQMIVTFCSWGADNTYLLTYKIGMLPDCQDTRQQAQKVSEGYKTEKKLEGVRRPGGSENKCSSARQPLKGPEYRLKCSAVLLEMLHPRTMLRNPSFLLELKFRNLLGPLSPSRFLKHQFLSSNLCLLFAQKSEERHF